MDKEDFLNCRILLGKTQKELSALLGMSLKAVHSYEQGWRGIPFQVERQLLFLVSRKMNWPQGRPCWEIKQCPEDIKKKCPAWEFGPGEFCWFICGTFCEGRIQENWNHKMEICNKCEILKELKDAIKIEIASHKKQQNQ